MYRAAIIGTGSFANAHADALRALAPRVQIAAAADSSLDKAQTFCAEFGIPAAYPNATALLRDAQPDLVHICTPPSTHVPLAIECLRAGSHVLCEKPLCGSLADFDALQAAARQSGRTLSNVFQWRFGSAARKLKAMIEAGDLGELRVAVCHTLWYRGDDYYAVKWRGVWERALGGTLMGHGIHLIDLMLWLLPDWRDVHARLKTFDYPVEVDNAAAALVEYKNGALASVISSSISPREETYLRLDFQKATVEVKGLYHYDNDNWSFYSPHNALIETWNAKPNEPNKLRNQVTALLDALDHGAPPPVSGDDARRIIEWMSAAHKSAFTRTSVERGSITPDDPFYQSMRGE